MLKILYHFICHDCRSSISREKFEELCEDLWAKALLPLKEVLQNSGLKAEEVSAVELIGGATRVPKLQVITISGTPSWLGMQFSMICSVAVFMMMTMKLYRLSFRNSSGEKSWTDIWMQMKLLFLVLHCMQQI